MIVTEAGMHPNVSALVYVAARAPDAGEDYAALAKTYVRSSLDSDHIADALTLRFRATCRHSRLRRLRGMLSETEHTELLLADLVGRVDRLRLAEIRDRLGAAVQCFIVEAAVVVGLDIGRIELDRLREICKSRGCGRPLRRTRC
jgi:hypothetical protein